MLLNLKFERRIKILLHIKIQIVTWKNVKNIHSTHSFSFAPVISFVEIFSDAINHTFSFAVKINQQRTLAGSMAWRHCCNRIWDSTVVRRDDTHSKLHRWGLAAYYRGRLFIIRVRNMPAYEADLNWFEAWVEKLQTAHCQSSKAVKCSKPVLGSKWNSLLPL